MRCTRWNIVAVVALCTLFFGSSPIQADPLRFVCSSNGTGKVLLQGVEAGRCPGELDVPTGTYKIEVIFDSGGRWSKTVTTEAGKPVLMFPVPTKEPEPVKKPEKAKKAKKKKKKKKAASEKTAPVEPAEEPEPIPAKAPAKAPEPKGCHKDAKRQVEQADALVDKKRLEKAVEAYTDALLVDPECEEAWHKVAMANALMGQFEQAIAQWEKVLALNPKNEVAKRNIRLARKKLEKKQSRKSASRPALKTRP
jgi:hypothetical protein